MVQVQYQQRVHSEEYENGLIMTSLQPIPPSFLGSQINTKFSRQMSNKVPKTDHSKEDNVFYKREVCNINQRN